MNSENSKINEPHNLDYHQQIDKPNIQDPSKNMALAKLSIYYTWRNIKLAYNNNKFKVSAPT